MVTSACKTKCPRKTLTSQYVKLRNDSTTSSLLSLGSDQKKAAVDADDNEEPRSTIFSGYNSDQNGYRISKTFCPDCYCKAFPVAPLLKPEDSCRCTSSVKPTSKASTRSVFLKYRPEERIEACGHLTTRRQVYENQSEEYFISLKKKLQQMEIELEHEIEEMLRRKEEYKRMQNTLRDAEGLKSQKDTIENLMAFRKSNYFACHSSAANLSQSAASGHVHVHRCHLNDKMKLSADNSDAFGISRCLTCNKSLSKDTLVSPPTINSRSTMFELEKSFCRSSFDQIGFAGGDQPANSEKMILTTSNNERLEVALPPYFLKSTQHPLRFATTSHTFKNFRMPTPRNSMALRHQKGLAMAGLKTVKTVRINSGR